MFNVTAATPAKVSPKGTLLFSVRTKENTEILISVAKGCDIAVGATLPTITNLSIIHGVNAQGEERYYATNKGNSMFQESDYAAL
jgi:hypothetical protein